MATNSAFARLVARPVDRVQLAASRVLTRDELSAIEGFDVSPGDAALVVSFLSRGPMTWDEIRVPLRYFPEERARARLEECVAGGVLTFDGEIIAYTPAGTEAALAALDARAAALQVMWSNSEAQVSELLARACDHGCRRQLPTLGNIAVPLAESQQPHGLRDDLDACAGLQA